jgi:hypothetical protein
MEDELFTSICNGDIQNSIMLSTKIIFLHESVDILENVYINICAYIGSFISLYDIRKLIDLYSSLKKIIENEKLIIKDIYVIISKMCILCDIYNKHPNAKCGNMSMKVLKDKISTLFNNNDLKLSNNGIMRFDGILPPHDHENYGMAIRIVAIIIKTIKSTDDISVDEGNTLVDISNKLRHIIDYILRSKYKFETKFYSTDNDNVWFLWGVFSVLYKNDILDDAFWLYNYEYKKKYRSKRIGILWSLPIISIYTHKCDISKGWTSKESNVIAKIEEISINLYNELRRKIIKDNPDKFERANKKTVDKYDGLKYILNFVPIIDNTINMRETNSRIDIDSGMSKPKEEIRHISY